MRDFQKRPGRGVSLERMLLGCGAMVALALIAFFSVRGAWGMYEKFNEAAAADEQAQANLTQLEQQEGQIKKDVAEVSTPGGIEGQVRERWGLAKPGEGEIDIVQAASSTGAAAAVQESLWDWILHAFSVF